VRLPATIEVDKAKTQLDELYQKLRAALTAAVGGQRASKRSVSAPALRAWCRPHRRADMPPASMIHRALSTPETSVHTLA
jgi:hypothetical protein